jgi:hypothetical protein
MDPYQCNVSYYIITETGLKLVSIIIQYKIEDKKVKKYKKDKMNEIYTMYLRYR